MAERQFEVEMFYDPRRIGILMIRDLYQRYDLEIPHPIDNIGKPFHTDEARGTQVAATKFGPLSKKSALELASDILVFLRARAEINPLNDF